MTGRLHSSHTDTIQPLYTASQTCLYIHVLHQLELLPLLSTTNTTQPKSSFYDASINTYSPQHSAKLQDFHVDTYVAEMYRKMSRNSWKNEIQVGQMNDIK